MHNVRLPDHRRPTRLTDPTAEAGTTRASPNPGRKNEKIPIMSAPSAESDDFAGEPASPLAPHDEELEAGDAEAFGRIRARGLKISASNLGSLLSIDTSFSGSLHGAAADAYDPVSPRSPCLPTPRGFGREGRAGSVFAAAGHAQAGEGVAEISAAASANPCIPAGRRASLTHVQVAAIAKVTAQRKDAKQRPHRNGALTHADDWVEILKTLGATVEECVPVLLQRAASLSRGLSHAGTARREDIVRLERQARAGFEHLSNASYVIMNEHFKVAFKGKKPRVLRWPDGDTASASEGVDMLRYLAGQLPQRLDAFVGRLQELDGVQTDYDKMLDKRRLRKAEAYVREATRVLA